MSEETTIQAQLEVEECTAELYLNGIPKIRIDQSPGRMERESITVDLFLVPGLNFIELLMEPGETPSSARTKRELPARPMNAVGRIVRYKMGEQTSPGFGEVLCETRTVCLGTPDESVECPVFNTSRFQHDPGHDRWIWQDLPPMVLDDTLITEARALLDEIEALIVARDVDGLLGLYEVAVADADRGFPDLVGPYLQRVLPDVIDDYYRFEQGIRPRDADEHDFRLVSGGRMLDLVDRDWSASLQRKHRYTGEWMDYSLMVARVNGKLRIMR